MYPQTAGFLKNDHIIVRLVNCKYRPDSNTGYPVHVSISYARCEMN